ncbi:MAG: VWA domain-containing protein [Burkholderiales bacterium]|nr:VWA domain-containing protein [Burkholderiales bacterium]
MEEWVGKLWDRFLRSLAEREHGAAAITLEEVAPTAGILFRAFGGAPGLTVKATVATPHGARRNHLARLAGVNQRVELAWRNGEALLLPSRLALFPQAALNRDLYLWLIALAAECDTTWKDTDAWFQAQQEASLRLWARYPGLERRYRQLVAALLPLRPAPERLPADEAAQERAIQAALRHPGHLRRLPQARRPWQPVPLWLHPSPPPTPATATRSGHAGTSIGGRAKEDRRRRQGERVDVRDGRDAFLLFFRAESILSWADYIRVHRPTEENGDADPAAADDIDRLAIARDGETRAARIRFDLDLPAPAEDDTPLGPGLWLPEWDFRTERLLPARCRIQPLLAERAAPCGLPDGLRPIARRLRRQFQALRPERTWLTRQPEGSELDLDALVTHLAERRLRRGTAEQGFYREAKPSRRDLACLLLADLSLSTDAYANDTARVIDVIRDSLFLFAEALSASHDRFGLYGFSSLRRDNVRFHLLKDFHEPYDDTVRGRIAAIKPGYYTRMGAALRQATQILAEQPAARRLLLLLTDGKPNDLDHYEGRYGIEDTRHAVMEARRRGITPFCVTIDRAAPDYLGHLFGTGHALVIGKAAELPRRLPRLYARLTT